MRRWIAALYLCFAVASGWAQQDELGKANDLYTQGKKLDALPLYEDLAKSYPKEWLYAERLAGCLLAKAIQSSDPAEVKALRTRVRDEAKRAVELGDPNYIAQLLAQTPIDVPTAPPAGDSGAVLLREAEKAFTAGNFALALDKYSQAANADPKLYEAPLYAGDTAYTQKDLPTAAKWFARAIAIDPNRETAYRYWGDALMRVGHDPVAAKPKFIDAVVAEPYNKLAWQGIQQWAQIEKATITSPTIDRPAAPVVDAKNPNNINIQISMGDTDDKKHPGASAWLMYSLLRAGYHGNEFKKNFPNEKQYRHSLKEESAALSIVATSLKEQKIQPSELDPSLQNLLELYDAGMLDCWILISAADEGIAMDYPDYRREHRQLLHDYLVRFVVHGGVISQ